jgi:hypothetical protein
LATARELSEQLDRLAQHAATSTPRLEAHDALGSTLFLMGEFPAARGHLEQGVALTETTAQAALVLRYGVAPGVRCLALVAIALWWLGSPTQSVQRSQEALALAQKLAHPQSLAYAQHQAASLHHRRRDALAVQAQAETLLTLATAQGFPLFVGHAICQQSLALAMQGQGELGLAQMHQGLAAILKWVSYALNLQSDRGQHKARVFESALGFNLTNWEGLKQAILAALPHQPATLMSETTLWQKV